ncbi:MAG: AAA family ATPase [Deferribacterota bacterium]|nr:AAA family ATPase [Deferribacterota bacterium]
MIYGHNFQKEYFYNAIKNNRLSSGYIFEGASGIGKKLFALYLAKYFYCKYKKYFDDCNCNNCQSILSLKHPMIKYIKEDELKINNIRELSEFIYLTGPDKKFIIINDAHNMTREAAASFLKTLEESPINIIFILITNNYHKIIPTIRSRCVRIPFNRLPKNNTEKIVKEQNINLKPTAIQLLNNSLNNLEIIREFDNIDNKLPNYKTINLITFIENITGRNDLINFIYFYILKFFDIDKIDKNLARILKIEKLLNLIDKINENVNTDIIKQILILDILEDNK